MNKQPISALNEGAGGDREDAGSGTLLGAFLWSCDYYQHEIAPVEVRVYRKPDGAFRVEARNPQHSGGELLFLYCDRPDAFGFPGYYLRLLDSSAELVGHLDRGQTAEAWVEQEARKRQPDTEWSLVESEG